MSVAILSGIDASTRCCAVLGHPVRHSASPAMQNAGMAALGLNWRYLAFDVLPEALPSAIKGAAALGFVGVNLTVPHKIPALECVDLVHESAKRWGAVNTIRFEGKAADGSWKPVHTFDLPPAEIRAQAFNTDADAIIRAIEEDLGATIRGSRVLLLGAGGAGRVAAMRLAEEKPGELFLVNRTMSKAEEIAGTIKKVNPSLSVTASYPTGKVDLVVNGTSLGLKPEDPLPYDEAAFAVDRARFAFDMVYGPQPTRFQREAESAGCKIADGLGMLLYQGAAALELWSGKPAPVETMRKALLQKVCGTNS